MSRIEQDVDRVTVITSHMNSNRVPVVLDVFPYFTQLVYPPSRAGEFEDWMYKTILRRLISMSREMTIITDLMENPVSQQGSRTLHSLYSTPAVAHDRCNDMYMTRNAGDPAYASMTAGGASARSAWGQASAPTSASARSAWPGGKHLAQQAHHVTMQGSSPERPVRECRGYRRVCISQKA